MPAQVNSILGIVVLVFSQFAFNLGAGADAASLSLGTIEASGGPGRMAFWPRPDKDGFSTTPQRPLWLTISQGALSEVFFPQVDRTQTQASFLMIKQGDFLYDERNSFTSETTRVANSLVYKTVSINSNARIEKTFLVHPDENSLILDYDIQFSSSADKELIFVHNPAVDGTPGGDSMQVLYSNQYGPILGAWQGDIRGDEPAALKPFTRHLVAWSLNNSWATVGFEGVNSPEDQLNKKQWPSPFQLVRYGNTAGALVFKTREPKVHFRVFLIFETINDLKFLNKTSVDPDKNFANALKVLGKLWPKPGINMETSLEEAIETQKKQWSEYLSKLNYDKKDSLAESSILVLKASEDKRFKGAIIAAPALPGIPWSAGMEENYYEDARLRKGDANGGYRRIWPRDLFHKALAFISVNDLETPLSILKWYQGCQLKNGRVGTWAQNSWADGAPSWGAYQQDQTAFPIILALRLKNLKLIDYAKYRDMVIAAATALQKEGPATGQERWEENAGISPNSLAVVVEGLMSAGILENEWVQENPQKFSAGELSKIKGRALVWTNLAKQWANNLKTWTLVKDGYWGQNYFERIEVGGPMGYNPNYHEKIMIHNKKPNEAAFFTEDAILDGGFLQWIMAGLVDPNDLDFSNTLYIYDTHLRKNTSYGKGYLRYNEDAYGANHKGGAWPILSAERGIVAIMRNEYAEEHLQFIRQSASSAGLIPEQDTMSVRPLAWSHAAYLIFLKSLAEKDSFYKMK